MSNNSEITLNTPPEKRVPSPPDVTIKIPTGDLSQHIGLPSADVTIKITHDDISRATSMSGRTGERKTNVSKTFLGIPRTRIQQYLAGSRNLRNVKEAESEIPHKKSRSKHKVGTFKAEADLLEVDKLYDNLSYVDEGGQGVLSLADDHSLHRQVAIKSLHKSLLTDAEKREQFIHEAQISAMLEHPSIIPIYNLCHDKENGLHLAMQFLHGKSLKEMMENIHALYEANGAAKFNEKESLSYRLSIFMRVCEAISFAHSKKIVHCDLKPENIMLGEFGEVYVMDWGIARDLSKPQVMSKKIFGTPRFLAPEVLSGSHFDERVDVYALGVILFEIVALKLAFEGDSDSEVIQRVCRHEMAPLEHQYGFAIDADLAAIIRKATNYDLHRRYQSVTELLIDIRHYLFHESVSANPDNVWTGISRYINNHRRGFSLWTLILMVSGFALWGIGAFESIAKAAISEQQRNEMASALSSSASLNGWHFGLQFTELAQQLAVLNSDIAMLLEYEINPEGAAAKEWKEKLCSVDALREGYKKLPEEIQVKSASSALPELIDRMSYAAPGEIKNTDKLLQRMSLLYPRMNELLKNKLTDGTRISSMSELKKTIISNGLPIRKLYFTLANGLNVIYPAVFEDMSDYDGRLRPWYIAAMTSEKPEIVWTSPYFDIDTGVPVISGTTRIVSPSGKNMGASGLDISLNFLYKQMSLTPASSGHNDTSRYIVNQDGQIIVEANWRDNEWRMKNLHIGSDNRIIMPMFENKAVFGFMKKSRFGHFIQSQEYVDELWVYTRIPSLNGYYVEKIEIEKQSGKIF